MKKFIWALLGGLLIFAIDSSAQTIQQARVKGLVDSLADIRADFPSEVDTTSLSNRIDANITRIDSLVTVSDEYRDSINAISARSLTNLDSINQHTSDINGLKAFDSAQGDTNATQRGELNTLNGFVNQDVTTTADPAFNTLSTDGMINLDTGLNYGTSSGLEFGDGDAGFYEEVDDKLIVRTAGTGRWIIQGSTLAGWNSNSASISTATATATVPVFATKSDGNTGLGNAGSDQLSLIAGAVEVMRLTQNDASEDVIDANGLFVSDNLKVESAIGSNTTITDGHPMKWMVLYFVVENNHSVAQEFSIGSTVSGTEYINAETIAGNSIVSYVVYKTNSSTVTNNIYIHSSSWDGSADLDINYRIEESMK